VRLIGREIRYSLWEITVFPVGNTVFPAVFYVPLLNTQTDTTVVPVSSKLSTQVKELTGCCCDRTGHLQNISRLPSQLLCSGFHLRPSTLWDENTCSNVFVPHSLVRNV
jgi:hypothetical protein